MWFIETSVHQRNSRVVQTGLEKNLGNKGKMKIRPKPPSATVPHRNHAQVFTWWVGMHRRSQACPVAQLLGDSCKLCKHIIKPINLSLSLSFVSVCLHGCLYDLIIAMCLRQFWIFIKLSSVCRHVICINLSNQMSWVSLCFTHDSWQLWRQCLVPFAMLPNGTSLQLIVDRIRTHQASDSKRFLARQTDLVG